MKYWFSLLLIVIVVGCTNRTEIPKEQLELQSYLEDKGFQVMSYEGKAESYELTKQKIVEFPYMMCWGLQLVNPSTYFGKTINVEKFIVKNHPLSNGVVDVYVYEVEGQPIGGTSYPTGDTSDGGYWSLEGKTLEELQPLPYQAWSKEWVNKYGVPTGFIHKDMFTLLNKKYEIYYWNTGDFSYTQFVIMKDEEIVFDSEKAGVSIEGGYAADKEGEVWVNGIEQNHRATFKFHLADHRPETAFLILEDIDNNMQVTVFDDVAVEYKDVDDDGNEELVSYPYSGQIPLGPALTTVYQWENNQYTPNISTTKRYLEDQLEQKELNFKDQPNEYSFDALLSAYLLLDRQKDSLERFPIYYEWAGQSVEDGGYVSEYKKLLTDASYDSIKGWMEKVKPLRKLRAQD